MSTPDLGAIRQRIAGVAHLMENERYSSHSQVPLLRDLAALCDRVERTEKFYRKVIEASWDEGDVDSGDIQEWAIEAGILVPTQMTEACAPGCRCEEYDNIPGTCYRFTALAADPPTEGETP